jgi:hypothetical protein
MEQVPGKLDQLLVVILIDTLGQDMQCVENCDDPKRQILYEQPVWQTLQMFLGEMLCMSFSSCSSMSRTQPPGALCP